MSEVEEVEIDPVVRKTGVPDRVEGVGGVGGAGDDGVWAPARRRLTAGLVLTVTLVAFESLAIATVMPVVADDLGGLGLYGWVFSGFFLGSLLGIVVAGDAADRRGTRGPYAVGLVLFTLGLIVGGAAPSMGVLVVGRVLQGLGAGVIPAVAYTSVGRAFPAAVRPRVFAVMSTAWLVPGLLGPAAASAIDRWTSWRVVFLALLPFVAGAAAMALPALSRADAAASAGGNGPTRASAGSGTLRPTPVDVTPASGGEAQGDSRWRGAVGLVVGVALVLAGLGAEHIALAVAMVAVGAPLAARAFVRLVPQGTVALARGMPAAVAARGILTFAFFGTDAYISLAITDARDSATWVAGLALTASTITWTIAVWIQQRLVLSRGPRFLVRSGFAVLAVAIAAAVVGLGDVPIAVMVAAWAVGGLGIGLSYAPISVTVLASAAPGEEGRASASVQLTDVLGVALGTGVAGVFVAIGEAQEWGTGSSLTGAFLVMLAVALAGVAAAGRLPDHLPQDGRST
jgi:MFS family permease